MTLILCTLRSEMQGIGGGKCAKVRSMGAQVNWYKLAGQVT